MLRHREHDFACLPPVIMKKELRLEKCPAGLEEHQFSKHYCGGKLITPSRKTDAKMSPSAATTLLHYYSHIHVKGDGSATISAGRQVHNSAVRLTGEKVLGLVTILIALNSYLLAEHFLPSFSPSQQQMLELLSILISSSFLTS